MTRGASGFPPLARWTSVSWDVQFGNIVKVKNVCEIGVTDDNMKLNS